MLHLTVDAMATGSWMGVRLLALIIWLLLVARLLPAADFGWLAGALGISAVCTLMASGGIPYLFFADAHAPDTDLRHRRWAEMLGCIASAGPVVALFAWGVLLVWMPLPVPAGLVLALVLAEVVLTSLVQASALFLHASGRLGAASGLPAMLMIGRAVAVGFLVMGVGNGLAGYLMLHIATAVIVSACALTWIVQVADVALIPRRPTSATLRSAWAFAAMGGGSLVSSELDKPLVGRIAGLASAGHYALAYRICAAAAMPATALSASLLPRWAKQAKQGRSGMLRVSFGLAALGVAGFGLGASLVLRFAVDQVPEGALGLYAGVWPVMRDLAWLVGPLGLHQLAGTALIAVNRPLTRAVLDGLGLMFLAGLIVVGFASRGMEGVAAASILAESAIAALMASAFLRALKESAFTMEGGE